MSPTSKMWLTRLTSVLTSVRKVICAPFTWAYLWPVVILTMGIISLCGLIMGIAQLAIHERAVDTTKLATAITDPEIGECLKGNLMGIMHNTPITAYQLSYYTKQCRANIKPIDIIHAEHLQILTSK